MSLLDELHGALRNARAALDAVGPKPTGDPHAIHACALVVRQHGDDVAAAAGKVAAVPAATAWVGPGADRLAMHAGMTAQEARSAAHELYEIADHLERESKRVRDEQERWAHARKTAQGVIDDITSSIGRVL